MNKTWKAADGRAFAEATGRTPMAKIDSFAKRRGLGAPDGVIGGTRLLLKLERVNPAGSVKDRIALAMIEDGLARGVIERGSTIVEPTSGNTGIALAALGRAAGFKVILTMPDNMSLERRALLRAYGASLELTPAAEGMAGAIARARKIASGIRGAWIPDQFNNPANPLAHYLTTGPEIWEQTSGEADVFVCGVGTGGTISGVGRYLKMMKPTVHIVAVEPESSPVLTRAMGDVAEGEDGVSGGGVSGGAPDCAPSFESDRAPDCASDCAPDRGPDRRGIQGIGAGFVPGTLDLSVIDEVASVSRHEALLAAQDLARAEGLLVGPSSGAALCAACAVAARSRGDALTVVILAPDSGERYLSEVEG